MRIVALGRVSCGEARDLARVYFARMAAGRCGRLNNFCDLTLPKGWSCSIFFAAESREAGGASSGCFRAATAAKVRFYEVGARAGVAVAAPLAHASGGNWTIEPTPGPAGPAESALTGVSCVSAATCMAVGTDDDARGSNAFGELQNVGSFSERWDGSLWTVVPTAGAAGANPGLYGVSCASPAFCVAVGQTHSRGRDGVNFQTASGAQRALIETWNGAIWTVQSHPAATLPGSGLFGVSCRSSSFCLAVGQHGNGALVEAWNGTNWSVQHTPTVARNGTWPAAVSCTSANACTLVGSYNANKGQGVAEGVPLAERWNGGQWSVQHVPGYGLYAPTLRSISCVSPSFCLASGTQQMGNGSIAYSPFAERWSGGRWTGAMAGLPKASALFSVSCVSVSHCLAAGQFDPRVFPPSSATDALAERWNGTRWARIAIPPVAAPLSFDQTDPALLGISCLAQIGCNDVDPGLWQQQRPAGAKRGGRTECLD